MQSKCNALNNEREKSMYTEGEKENKAKCIGWS